MYEWFYSFAFRDSEIVEEIEVQTLKPVSSDMCNNLFIIINK